MLEQATRPERLARQIEDAFRQQHGQPPLREDDERGEGRRPSGNGRKAGK